MIITKTPYRVSFFGGGTDFPSYYEEHGGAVISCTINRYSYLQYRILPPFFDHRYRIRYFQTERTGSIEEIAHPSVRECLRFLDYKHPLEILHSGDIPHVGNRVKRIVHSGVPSGIARPYGKDGHKEGACPAGH